MSSSAYLDVHSHLLPGLDDGCVSLADSLTCVRRLKEHGFIGTVCTPHVCLSEYPHNTPHLIAEHVQKLRREIEAADLDYKLWAGAEVRLTEDTIRWFGEHGVPTSAGSRCVMLDTWGERWEPFCQEVVEFLFAESFQPILAHPERMNLEERQLQQLLDRLRDAGVWLQGNLRCITGAEGSLPESRMRRWLGEGRYQLVATDMHGPQCLDKRLEGIPILERLVGAEELVRLLSRQPADLVQAPSTAPSGVVGDR